MATFFAPQTPKNLENFLDLSCGWSFQILRAKTSKKASKLISLFYLLCALSQFQGRFSVLYFRYPCKNGTKKNISVVTILVRTQNVQEERNVLRSIRYAKSFVSLHSLMWCIFFLFSIRLANFSLLRPDLIYPFFGVVVNPKLILDEVHQRRKKARGLEL